MVRELMVLLTIRRPYPQEHIRCDENDLVKMFVFQTGSCCKRSSGVSTRRTGASSPQSRSAASGEEENAATRTSRERAGIEVKKRARVCSHAREIDGVDDTIAFIQSLNWATKMTVTRDYAGDYDRQPRGRRDQ